MSISLIEEYLKICFQTFYALHAISISFIYQLVIKKSVKPVVNTRGIASKLTLPFL